MKLTVRPLTTKIQKSSLSFCPGKIKLVPRLTLFIQVEGGDKVDAVLSPETKEYLEHLAAQQPGNAKSQYLAKTKPTPDSLKSEKV